LESNCCTIIAIAFLLLLSSIRKSSVLFYGASTVVSESDFNASKNFFGENCFVCLLHDRRLPRLLREGIEDSFDCKGTYGHMYIISVLKSVFSSHSVSGLWTIIKTHHLIRVSFCNKYFSLPCDVGTQPTRPFFKKRVYMYLE
jgi:hypothetical protein